MDSALTVVVLTLNESDRIARCLESLPRHAKVLVLDSYSSDDTLQRAAQTWATLQRPSGNLALVQRPWPGFTAARNASREWVTTHWVFWLDADEWLSPALSERLEHLDQLPRSVSIADFPRRSRFLGRFIRFGGWYPDRKRRLARTAQAEWRSGPNGSDVHEDLYAHQGEVAHLGEEILHEPFRDTRDQEDTNERYSSLLASGLAARLRQRGSKAPSGLYIRWRMLIKFIENYFWKLGCLDGYPGFVIARGSARSLGLRLRKAGELLR
ncbi:MAG: glycosyltransferase family 2 protein [Bdellovibrionales bacterium]|nr:glycosyltransferase family 2 protein [Bdellovibrionales bacterium]